MNFFKQMLSESGEVSYGRFGSLLALLGVIAWGSWIAFKKREMPPLTEPTLFVTSLYGTSKALTKGSEVARAISDNSRSQGNGN